MIKSEEIKNPDSCLNQAEDDEPLFVLKAGDELAPEIVEEWIRRSELHMLHTGKLKNARRIAGLMRDWKKKHP